jgi:hypothetical protein
MTGLKEVQKHTLDPQIVVSLSGYHQPMAGDGTKRRSTRNHRDMFVFNDV